MTDQCIVAERSEILVHHDKVTQSRECCLLGEELDLIAPWRITQVSSPNIEEQRINMVSRAFQ